MGQSLTRFLNLYVGTGSSLLGSFVLTLFIYALWGVGWFALLEYLFTDDSIKQFQDGMSGISFILSAIYYRWLMSAFDGYNDGPTALRNLLLSIKTLASVFLNTVSVRSDVPMEKVRKCFSLTDAMAFYSFRLYIDHDYEHYGKSSETVSERKRVQWLVNAFVRELADLNNSQYLTNAQYNSITELLQPLYTRFNNADINIVISDPPFIQNHLLFVLFIYFFFAFPFTLYVQIGKVMVYSYPFLMTLFTGAYLIRRWQDDPLSINSPFGTLKYFEWRREIRKAMKQEYESIRKSTYEEEPIVFTTNGSDENTRKSLFVETGIDNKTLLFS